MASRLPVMIAEPRVASQGGFVTAAEGTGDVAPRALASLGQSLAQAGLTVAAVEKDARDTSDVIAARSSYTEALDRKRIELESDPDYRSREGKLRAFADTQRSALGKSMSYAAQRTFADLAERTYSVSAHNLREQARRDEVEEHVLRITEANNKELDAALKEGNPVRRKLILDRVEGNIRAAQASNILSATQAERLHKGTLKKFDTLQVAELMRTNPSAAVALANDPKRTPFLDPLERKELALKAQQRAESLGTQARAEVRADLTLYEAARRSGQGVDEETYQALFDRAQRASPDLARRLAGVRYFYDRVDEHTTGKTLPQLRESVAGLERGSSLTDLGIARAVRRELAGAEREERQKLGDQLKEFETYRRQGEAYPKFAELVKRAEDLGGTPLGDAVRSQDAMWSRIGAARKTGSADIAERIQMIETERRRDQGGQLTLEDLTERQALVEAFTQKRRELDQDSAAFAFKYYPTVREAYAAAHESKDRAVLDRAHAALVEAQRREGVAEHKIALITKGRAEQIEADLGRLPNAKQIELVDELRATYGEQYWGFVKAQLNQGKPLPAHLEVVASLPPGARSARVELAEAYKTTREQDRQALGPAVMTEIDEAVRGKTQDVRDSFARSFGGNAFADAFQSATEKLAAYYARTMPAGAAVDRAYARVFGDHWEVVNGVRVPKANGEPVFDLSRVRDLQRFTTDRIGEFEIALPPATPADRFLTEPQRKAMYVRVIRRDGFFVSAPDERGMILFAAPGIPVLRKDGSPIVIPFDRPETEDFLRWRSEGRGGRERAPAATNPAAPRGSPDRYSTFGAPRDLPPDRDPYSGERR